MATAAGLASVVAESSAALTLLKLIGEIYLTVLGLLSIYSALVASPREPQVLAVQTPDERLGSKAAAQGLMSNLSNPKMAAFFVGFLPQFVSGHGALLGQTVILGAMFSMMTFVWLSACSALVHRATAAARHARFARAIAAASGSALLILGTQFAWSAAK